MGILNNETVIQKIGLGFVSLSRPHRTLGIRNVGTQHRSKSSDIHWLPSLSLPFCSRSCLQLGSRTAANQCARIAVHVDSTNCSLEWTTCGYRRKKCLGTNNLWMRSFPDGPHTVWKPLRHLENLGQRRSEVELWAAHLCIRWHLWFLHTWRKLSRPKITATQN